VGELFGEELIFGAGGVFLVRSGLLIVWLQLDSPVSASFWHMAGTLLAA